MNKFKKWIYAPEKYQLVVGDTFELFYRGIIMCTNPYIYNIDVKCPKGSAYKRKFMYTPTADDIGEYKLTIELSDDYGQILDYAEITLCVNPAAESPKEDTYILCVGDSLTSAGHWPSECLRRMTATDEEPSAPQGLGLKNLHFIGTKEGKYGAWYEGYGGWRFEDYNYKNTARSLFKYIITHHTKTDLDRHSKYTDGASNWKLEEIENGRIKLRREGGTEPLKPSGTLTHLEGGNDHSDIVYTEVNDAANNPFWNEASDCVDFKAYAKKVDAPKIDMCFVLLGWNASGSTADTYKPQVRLFVENLRRDYPECKIVFIGLQMTSSFDGLGTNYGTSWNYIEKNEYTKRLESWYLDICKEYDKMYYVNLAGQFDSEYNYPTTEKELNIRTEKKSVIQSNGVHPNLDGYMQIGDAMFRQLNAMLCEMNAE